MITNGWMNDARGWDIHMANKGYIMFTLDNRGSSNRGLEFENVTSDTWVLKRAKTR